MYLLKQTKIYRNNQITIPNSFMISEQLTAGDDIEIYVDTLNGKKVLTVIPATSKTNLIQDDCKNLVNINEKQV